MQEASLPATFDCLQSITIAVVTSATTDSGAASPVATLVSIDNVQGTIIAN